jgi:hypothetical protein
MFMLILISNIPKLLIRNIPIVSVNFTKLINLAKGLSLKKEERE